ncbi:MAG: GNAT family N-acetyltransferase [Actinomycetia bacterium]|nr:GNAT family N-acetyltransferase [Actinomycetes bacterium]
MADVRVRIVTDLVDDAQLGHELSRCWLDVSNAGGAVGFPFLPVSIAEVNEATQRLARDVASGSVLVFVAEVERELVGWVSLRFNSSELTRHWASVARLQSRPDRRGLGIGRELMAALAAHASSLGLEQLQLVLRGGENLEDFYARLGWREIGRHPAALRLSDGDRDEVFMVLDLPKS